jgi:hypothetical protein
MIIAQIKVCVLFVVKNALVHRGVPFVIQEDLHLALQVQLDQLAAAPCALRASTRTRPGALLATHARLASSPLQQGRPALRPARPALQERMPISQAAGRAHCVLHSARRQRAAPHSLSARATQGRLDLPGDLASQTVC